MLERCTETIDLEECIAMAEKKKKHYKIIATYHSGRTEVFAGKLKTDGTMNKKGEKRYAQLKTFPTVKSVRVERH